MNSRWIMLTGTLLLAGAGSLVAACGGGAQAAKLPTTPGGTKDQNNWPADDRSLCNWKGHAEYDVQETSGPGALKPNVRRVFKTIGEAEQRRQVLVCREIDTNLDGIKDVFRTFNEKGEAKHEEADTDYDGRIDVWMNFVDGRLAEELEDTNHDGNPDVWKTYVAGTLARIKRDRNFDGKPDVWEMYTKGRLERMGVDDTGDGHIDRWDRDELLRFESDQAEKAAADAQLNQANAADAGAPPADKK